MPILPTQPSAYLLQQVALMAMWYCARGPLHYSQHAIVYCSCTLKYTTAVKENIVRKYAD